MTDQNCAYCMEGDLVAQFGIKTVSYTHLTLPTN